MDTVTAWSSISLLTQNKRTVTLVTAIAIREIARVQLTKFHSGLLPIPELRVSGPDTEQHLDLYYTAERALTSGQIPQMRGSRLDKHGVL
ncbi:MAG: hypothetical protein ACI909_003796 [Planctomycetota bacterium]|jgi:hypothetical protein